MKPTLDQAGKILELISQSGRTDDWLQEDLIGSGAFSDVLAVDNLRDMDREERRRFFGIVPLNPPVLESVNFFRETEELTIQIPALARPTLAKLREKYPWIREENGIERDISPTEAVTLKLGTILRPDEERIDGTEYQRRRAVLSGQFGYQQLNWLVEHQDEHPAFKALLGKIYIDGTGLIVVDADGDRNFPCLGGGGKRWSLDWDSVDDGLGRVGRFAVSSK